MVSEHTINMSFCKIITNKHKIIAIFLADYLKNRNFAKSIYFFIKSKAYETKITIFFQFMDGLIAISKFGVHLVVRMEQK